jgi:SAM-dependent methyltransferase
MRDYSRFDEYLDELQEDIYPQPPDKVHTLWAIDSLKLLPEVDTVLDVGCGEGFLKSEFEKVGIVWSGITLGLQDWIKGKSKTCGGLFFGDFTFSHLPDNFVELVYARHSLEHSPFPILTLMEWRRISTDYLLLVAPAPEYWGYTGRNHYSVMNEDQLWWSLRRAGWKIVERDYLRTDDPLVVDTYRPEMEDRTMVEYPGPARIIEYRYLCEKVSPKIE